MLMDTVARLQLEVEVMKFGPPDHQILGRPTSPVRSKPMVFTSTKVPSFAGITSWEQYRQVLTPSRSRMGLFQNFNRFSSGTLGDLRLLFRYKKNPAIACLKTHIIAGRKHVVGIWETHLAYS